MRLLLIVLLFVFIFIDIPVAFSLSICSLLYFFFVQHLPHEIFIQKMIAANHSFPLLAIPFFITMGTLMNHSGITKRIINFADVLTGHMAGGLAQVNVVLSTLMGGICGSSNADAAMEAKIVGAEMIRQKYDGGFTAVVTACSSIISILIPPGIGLILYAFLADVSIGQMFVAGVIPGILLCFTLMLLVNSISKKRHYIPSRAKRATAKEVLVALKDAIWALVIPVGIIGGIRFGIFTPTEAGAMAVVYAILVGVFAYKELKLKDIPDILMESVLNTSTIMLIICGASAFGFYLSWENIPVKMAIFLIGITKSPIILLLLMNIFLLILGGPIEGSAALILLTPLLVPVVKQMGIDLVHFGIVIVFNLTIAGVTPPTGIMMNVTCSILKVPIVRFVRELVPFLILLVLFLLLLTYVPPITLFLPQLIFRK